jgi:uncharacterized membrane protein (DUF4010 family)
LREDSVKWVKPCLTLVVVGLLAWLSPAPPLDPWHLISPKKIATMVFALVFIQIFGSVMARALGARTGALLTGFFGGLVSSTATTASLARRSEHNPQADSTNELLIFLSATLAMLFEAAALVVMGSGDVHTPFLITLALPMLTSIAMILYYYRKQVGVRLEYENPSFQIAPMLKLTCFIVSMLLLSKLLQNLFGQRSLLILTFLVSLFEIHGSVIANVQLHENGFVDVDFLCAMLAISVVASYLSKAVLIATLGSKSLRNQSIKMTALLFMSLFVSYSIAVSL